MIGFSDSKFLKEYIKPQKDKKTGLIKDKLEDNFQTGKQKLLPFTLNPTSGCVYDGTCGLNGVAGEFYRIKTQSTATPIYFTTRHRRDFTQRIGKQIQYVY